MRTHVGPAWLALLLLPGIAAPGQGPATRPDANTPSHDPRLWVDGKVNGRPVRLALDTGAEDIVLFGAAAARLKLKVHWPSPNAPVPAGRTRTGRSEECSVSIGRFSARRRLAVARLPGSSRRLFAADGVVGWAVVRKNLLHFRVADGRVAALSELPANRGEWTTYRMLKDLPILAFDASGRDDANAVILVDTGDPGGVALSAGQWQRWRRANAERPATLTAAVTLHAGLVVSELCWADRITLGTVAIRDVPVTRSAPSGIEGYQATLGLFALTRLEMIADWRTATLHVRPVRGRNWAYPYNRLGAVFVPGGRKGNDLVAHVVEGSPAHEAGIRSRDVLLAIDGLDVTHWRTEPAVLPLHRFWSRAPGTRLRLRLERQGKPVEVTVELREIFTQAREG
jgi:hypothetical protein